MSRKIKSIKRFNQNFKNFRFGDIATHAHDEYLELNVTLDEKGNTHEEVKFDSTGEVEEKNSYEFDSNGKLISHTLLYAVDNVTEKKVFKRNEKGLLISEIKYYGDDAGEKTEYEYDEKDNVTAIIHYDEEGAFSSREEMRYDEKGSLSERISFDAGKNIISSLKFTSPENNTIEETEFDSSDNLLSKSVIKFDDKGKELSTIQTNLQGKLVSAITNIYDDRGNITEKIYKDFYSKKLKYDYNEKDQLISQELFDDSGLLLRKNLFEYDDEGNVIAEQTYEMDTARGGRDKHFGTRYEYEFFEE